MSHQSPGVFLITCETAQTTCLAKHKQMSIIVQSCCKWKATERESTLRSTTRARVYHACPSTPQRAPHRVPRTDSDGLNRPVGLLAAAYNNEPLPDMPEASSSGRTTTKPWQPASQQRPSAFDRYGTFPDIRDEDEDDHIETALTTKQYARTGSNRSLGSGASGEAALDPDYDIVPMYVVPLFKHQMVVVPVPKPGPGGAQGPDWMKSVVNTGQAMQKRAAETWDSLKNSDPDSIKNKVYRYAQNDRRIRTCDLLVTNVGVLIGAALHSAHSVFLCETLAVHNPYTHHRLLHAP